jgi:uncharacterized MAPEG superfamily protein
MMQFEQAMISTPDGQILSSKALDMTFPLWGLAIFIVWTIAVVALLLVVRIRHLSAGGSVKDFATPNEESLLWRLFRVHSNLIENLPLYLGVVFLLTVRGVSGTVVDLLIVVYIVFRLVHSVIHIAGIDPKFRLLSLVIQLSCLLALTTLAIL